MLRKIHLLFFSFLLVTFLQNTVSVSAQTKQINSEVRPFTDLTLEIDLPQPTLLSLEPIPIIIKQSNKTNQPVMGRGGISFGMTPIRLYVKKVGSNERVMVTMLTALSYFVVYTDAALAPGHVAETKGLITIGLDKYFPEPGIYEIQAELGNAEANQYIQSNKVNIEIKMPTGTNLAAYNLIKNSSHQDFFFSGARFAKVKDILETLTLLHPNTPYGKNSAFHLGATYFALKQYPQALTNLIRLENDRDFIFADKVKDYLRQIRQAQTQQIKDEGQ